MKTTIISIGNELLIGKTANTNLTYLAQSIREIGCTLSKAHTLPDEEQEIHKILKSTEDDLIIFTGGLGPTHDDITKESVCSFFDLKLELHEESMKRINQFFAKMNRTVAKTNNKQAYFPKDAIVLNNEHGSAPGVIIKASDKTIVLLPGPPSELQPMFENVKVYLKERIKNTNYQTGYLIVGIGEADMEEKLQPFYEQHKGVEINPYAGLASIQYIFTSKDSKALEKAMDDFRSQFDEYIVGPYNVPLEKRIVDTLIARNLTISFAESCTAGMVSARLVNVADASKVFKESYILYSNEAKIKQLGINQLIIERFGAVSDQCVYELAYQLAQRTESDIILSVSGVAGPSGGSATKPVGMVYFGIYYEGKTKTYHKVFAGDRNMIREKATTYGLYLVLRTLMHEDTDE